MTCTGGRLAAFATMDDQLSVPRDVYRSSYFGSRHYIAFSNTVDKLDHE